MSRFSPLEWPVLRQIRSGDLLGREKRLLLNEREARAVLAGHTPVEHLLLPPG